MLSSFTLRSALSIRPDLVELWASIRTLPTNWEIPSTASIS
jgi:hypothetical protein